MEAFAELLLWARLFLLRCTKKHCRNNSQRKSLRLFIRVLIKFLRHLKGMAGALEKLACKSLFGICETFRIVRIDAPQILVIVGNLHSPPVEHVQSECHLFMADRSAVLVIPNEDSGETTPSLATIES